MRLSVIIKNIEKEVTPMLIMKLLSEFQIIELTDANQEIKNSIILKFLNV